MMIPALRTVLDRVETWPEERQAEAATLLVSLDGADDLVVPDEEVAEIERMLANPDEPTLSHEEFKAVMADYLR